MTPTIGDRIKFIGNQSRLGIPPNTQGILRGIGRMDDLYYVEPTPMPPTAYLRAFSGPGYGFPNCAHLALHDDFICLPPNPFAYRAKLAESRGYLVTE